MHISFEMEAVSFFSVIQKQSIAVALIFFNCHKKREEFCLLVIIIIIALKQVNGRFPAPSFSSLRKKILTSVPHKKSKRIRPK